MADPQAIPVSKLIAEGLLLIGDGYRAKNSELGPDGLPFARAANIASGFAFDDADRFPEADLKRVGDKVSAPGDVVFTSKGTVGRFAWVDEGTERFVYSPQLSFWRSLDSSTIDSRWLYYWMSGPDFRSQYSRVKGQTDMADYVSLRDQRRMVISLPPIFEQRAIASVLGDLDNKIELNRRMNETLEALARVIFTSWFVDFDPVRAKAEGRQPVGMDAETAALFPASFGDSPLGPIPSEWRVLALDRVATFLNGLALQRFHPSGLDDLPVIKIPELRSGISASTGRASADVPDAYVVGDGDVLFSWSGSLLAVLWAGGPGALNQHLFRVTSDDFPRWLYYEWILRHLDRFRAIAAGKATTMGHIQRIHLAQALCVIPPDPLIRATSALIEPLLQRVVLNGGESRALRTVRDSLLPKLVSGEVRAVLSG